MKFIKEWAGTVALVILAISGLMNLFPANPNPLGTAVDCSSITCFTTVGILTSLQVDGTTIFNGTTTYNALQTFLSGLKIGTLGSTVSKHISTTCNLIINDTTILASTTKKFDCAVTGARAGDRVWADFATTSPAILINGVSASSTNDFVTFSVTNVSGGTITTAGSNVGSSTQVMLEN